MQLHLGAIGAGNNTRFGVSLVCFGSFSVHVITKTGRQTAGGSDRAKARTKRRGEETDVVSLWGVDTSGSEWLSSGYELWASGGCFG